MQENEKNYQPMESDKLAEHLDVQLLKALRELKISQSLNKQLGERIQDLTERNEDLVQSFTRDNFNLNLCKTYFSKLISSHLTSVELKRDIKEFLESIK